MFKKITLLSLAIATGILHARPNEQPLNGQTLPRYAEEYIHTLFGTHRDQPAHVREYIKHIKDSAVSSSEENCGQFWFIFNMGYDRACVEYTIKIKAMDIICNDAQQYAREYTGDEETINKITAAVRKEILELLSNSSSLNGILRNYLSDTLKKRVWDLKNKFDAEKRIAQPNRYPSQASCSCLESFGHGVERVFLDPCGHDMCPDCAREWFFERNNPNCPTCRTEVSKRKLAQKIGN